MVRRKSGPVISKKMYTHFAAVTIGLTAMIGIFADGEAKDAVHAELNEAEAKRNADYQQRKQGEIIRRDNEGGGGEFGTDGDYGSGGIGGWAGDAAAGASGSVDEGTLRRLGLTAEQFEALSPEEQERLLASLGNSGAPVSAAQHERANDALLAGSSERSGSSISESWD